MSAFFQESRRQLNETCAVEHPQLRCNITDNQIIIVFKLVLNGVLLANYVI